MSVMVAGPGTRVKVRAGPKGIRVGPRAGAIEREESVMERDSRVRVRGSERGAEHDPQERAALWFLISGNRIVLSVRGGPRVLPSADELKTLLPGVEKSFYLGRIQGRPCYAAEVSEDTVLPTPLALVELRRYIASLEDALYREAAGYASEIIHWERNHRYCGRCGAAVRDGSGEYVKVCSECGLHSYPRISPAVIVGVRRGNELLLVQAHRHRAGMYSNVAGFVEAGESLEQTVAREVLEETGIRIRNIRYFGSQAWPFPSTLMIGFTAEYGGGEIRREEDEILDARWFAVDALPRVPERYTIARRIIDHLCDSAVEMET